MTTEENIEQGSPKRNYILHKGEPCCVPKCDRYADKGDMCSAHRQRVYKHGDPRADIPLRPWARRKEGQLCAVDECESLQRKRGWCMKHYDRWRANGDPMKTKYPPNCGSKRVNNQGYIEVLFNRKIYSEHRLVWESHHGPLLPGQNVHHKNGVRDDNRIENLEVWDTTQPAGQRPEDKVAHALEIIKRYPELAREAGIRVE